MRIGSGLLFVAYFYDEETLNLVNKDSHAVWCAR